MAILIDTNVLLRSIQPSDPLNPQALSALHVLAQKAEVLTVFPQNVVEFWTVATRPRANNGLGLAPSDAKTEVDTILNAFHLLPETPAIFDEWKKLVVGYGVSGRDTHDARIVAAMNVHRVGTILTFDEEDFRRYQPTIKVLTPTAANTLTP